MIKLTKITLAFLVLTSCLTESTKETNSLPKTDTIISNQTDKKDTDRPETIGKIYAYSDSIEIYSNPNDTSAVLEYLQFTDFKYRIDLYAEENGNYTNSGFHSSWCAILLDNDTAWIKKQPNISTEYDIDTIKNIVILNYYGHCDFGGYGCYYRTRVINLVDKRIILEKYFNTKTTYKLDKSHYLLTPYGEVMIYDLNSDTIVYSSYGKLITNSDLDSTFYFVRKRKKDTWRNPVELIAFDYNLDSSTILYKEPNDTTFPCIAFDDGESCSKLKTETHDTIEYIYLTLYKMKENPIDEGDVYEYEIKIDNRGKFYYRKQK